MFMAMVKPSTKRELFSVENVSFHKEWYYRNMSFTVKKSDTEPIAMVFKVDGNSVSEHTIPYDQVNLMTLDYEAYMTFKKLVQQYRQ
jgi:hypothetical protein